jgi:3',5'-cyclic AMP phosphodiesterase CpdA/energy-coupling factor transporter ATP-binding protein EcfA2
MHISDTQFGSLFGWSDAKTLANSLIKDADELVKNRDIISKPKFLVVSGDLTSGADLNEFNEFKEFIELLMEGLGIAKSNVIVVPGNHDVNWMLDRKIKELKDDIYNDVRFLPYAKFFNAFYEGIHTIDITKDPENYFYTIDYPEDNLTFLNLNSCVVSDSEKDIGFLGIPQLERAFESLLPGRRAILVFHHHLISITSRHYAKDDSVMGEALEIRDFLNGKPIAAILHGHQHLHFAQSLTTYFGTQHSRLNIISAGSVSVCSKERLDGLIPNQYHLVGLDPLDYVYVTSRFWDGVHSKWRPDIITHPKSGQTVMEPYQQVFRYSFDKVRDASRTIIDWNAGFYPLFGKVANLGRAGLRQPSGKEFDLLKKLSQEIKVEKGGCWLLVGSSGIGKTTLLSKLLEVDITIYVYVNSFPYFDFLDFLTEYLTSLTGSVFSKEEAEILVKDKTLLIDVAYQIPDSDTLFASINDFATRKICNLVIAISEDFDPKEKLNGRCFYVLPLSDKQISNVAGKNTFKRIESEQLKDICSVPLFLNIYTTTQIEEKARTGLIKSLILNTLLTKRIKKLKEIVESLGFNLNQYEIVINHVLKLLSVVAFHSFSRKTDFLQQIEAVSEMIKSTGLSENYSKAVFEIGLASGLLKKIATRYDFVFPIVEEYLVGYYFTNYKKPDTSILENKMYRNAIIFYAYLEKDSTLIEQLENLYKETSNPYLIVLTLACQKELGNDEYVADRLLDIYALPDDDFYQIWNDLFSILYSWQSDMLVNHAKKVVLDLHTPKALNLIHHIRELENDGDFIEHLLRQLEESQYDPHMLYSLIEVARIGQVLSLEVFLKDMLNTTSDPIVKAQCLRVLNSFNKPLSIDNMSYNSGLVSELVLKYKESDMAFIKGHCLIELCAIDPRTALQLYNDDPSVDTVIKYHKNYGIINSQHHKEFIDYVDY